MKPTKQIALDMGCAFCNDDWNRVNLYADRVAMGATLVVETLPISGVIDYTFAPVVRVSKRVIFAFLTHCDLDFEGEDLGEIVDAMTEVGKEYIYRLNNLGIYEFLEKPEYITSIDFLDSNLAGVRVEVELKEIQGECLNE